MKKMTNDYFLRFCDIVERSMPDPSQFDNCRKDMIDASLDDRNEVFVYTDTSHNMEVLKLDEYTKEFEKKAETEVPAFSYILLIASKSSSTFTCV